VRSDINFLMIKKLSLECLINTQMFVGVIDR